MFVMLDKTSKMFTVSCRKFSQINANILSLVSKSENIEIFKRSTSIRMNKDVPKKQAAILVPICISGDRVSLLYTMRSAELRTFSKQVSFPGGIIDDNELKLPPDESAIRAALRETKEEVGISSSRIKILGIGNKIIPLGGPSMIPVLGLIEDFDTNMLTRNESEVESIFNVEIEMLIKFKGHTQFRGGYSTPVYFGGEERIWGMTATITHFFLNSFLTKEQYNFKIPFIKKYQAPLLNSPQSIQNSQITA